MCAMYFQSYQVTWQEEVCDALADGVLMAAVGAHQFSLHDLRLHEQVVQVLQRLLVALQLLHGRGLRRESWETKLMRRFLALDFSVS